MNPSGSDGDALQPSHQAVQGTDVQETNVVSDHSTPRSLTQEPQMNPDEAAGTKARVLIAWTDLRDSSKR
ncbi:hypothetical protein PHMEG_000175 [Phytophthora megakarya]|uniref:Uncharacterized protein n=1 Tax=Phytophthora megakarya TaxID=4795 RepID=A0A225X5X1_9STRA|nr:hypothetical protein PHMEG_000175 [Phytophthora megakarya]